MFLPSKIGDGGLKLTVAYFCEMDWVKRQLVLIHLGNRQQTHLKIDGWKELFLGGAWDVFSLFL